MHGKLDELRANIAEQQLAVQLLDHPHRRLVARDHAEDFTRIRVDPGIGAGFVGVIELDQLGSRGVVSNRHVAHALQADRFLD